MRKNASWLIAALAAMAFPPGAPALAGVLPPPDASIIVMLEQPTSGVNTGVNLVRGYALSPAGIDFVEWFLDGTLKGRIPYGGSRGDVAAAFPGFPDSQEPGFATAWNWALETPGEHGITVRAWDLAGHRNDASAIFETDRFPGDPFVTDAEMSLDAFRIDGIAIAPSGFLNDFLGLTLAWSQAEQQFTIQAIDLTCQNCAALVQPPPGNLVATRMGDIVDLSWDAPSPAIQTPLGYYLERRVTGPLPPNPPFRRVAVLATDTRTYTDSDVDFTPIPLLGTAYQYRVRAVHGDSVSAPSNTDSVAIPFAPPAP